jgi:hypothetical protein
MDLEKKLLENNLFIDTLYKYLDDNGYFEDFKEMADAGEMDLDTLSIAGYRYDGTDIVVVITYEDEVVETGIGIDWLKVNLDDFKYFLENEE